MLEKISTFLIVFLLSFSASAESLRELIEVGLQSHPSVSAEEYRVASGEADMKTARWQYYPTLALQFNTGDRSSAFSERSFSDSFEDLDDNNTTTVSLEQPLWTGGRLRGGARQSQRCL
ncbi:TolC family protein [Haliea sp. AH-315-K21]|nr:TolC family protein [Haliea sp. AH-315-K21]